MTAQAVPAWATAGASAVIVHYSSWGTPTRTEVTITRATATQLVVTYPHGATARFFMVRGSDTPREMNGRAEWHRDSLVPGTDPMLATWDEADRVDHLRTDARKAADSFTRHPHPEAARLAIDALQAWLEAQAVKP